MAGSVQCKAVLNHTGCLRAEVESVLQTTKKLCERRCELAQGHPTAVTGCSLLSWNTLLCALGNLHPYIHAHPPPLQALKATHSLVSPPGRKREWHLCYLVHLFDISCHLSGEQATPLITAKGENV